MLSDTFLRSITLPNNLTVNKLKAKVTLSDFKVIKSPISSGNRKKAESDDEEFQNMQSEFQNKQ